MNCHFWTFFSLECSLNMLLFCGERLRVSASQYEAKWWGIRLIYQMIPTRIIKDYIGMRDIYYTCEPQKHDSNHFKICLYLTIHSALFSLVVSTTLLVKWLALLTLIFGIADSSLRWLYLYVDFILFSYWWVVFIELLRHILKINFNYDFKFKNKFVLDPASKGISLTWGIKAQPSIFAQPPRDQKTNI